MTDPPVIGVTHSSDDLHIFTLWRRMFEGVVAAGAVPVALNCVAEVADIEDLVSRMDGLIISGGADVDPIRYGADPTDPTLRRVSPIRDENELRALACARSIGLPVFAICRGAQLVNVAFGGVLYGDLARDLPGAIIHAEPEESLAHPSHTVDVLPGTRLANWLGTSGTIPVNSSHHQGILEVGTGLVPTALAPDGLIEGIEAPGEPVVGVQWHPELMWPAEEYALRVLGGFVAECAHLGAQHQRVPPAP
jgi:putative glutamine amidotransferase